MKKATKFIWILILFFLLLGSIFISQPLGSGVRAGLELSYQFVLPALFPSMILCGIIGEWIDAIPLPPTFTLWITSHLCGFPLGIRTITQCYRRGLISREQTIRLSTCCSNASPAFLIAYLGKMLINNTRMGLYLYIAQLLISFNIGAILRSFEGTPVKENTYTPFLTTITQSFSSAATGSLSLTVYITFFSAISALFENLPSGAYLYGIIELVGGLSKLPSSNFYPIATLVGFSGISVMMQNGTYLVDHNLPIWPMFCGKILYAVLMPFFCLFLNTNFWLSLIFLSFPGIFIIVFDKLRKKVYNKLKQLKRGLL